MPLPAKSAGSGRCAAALDDGERVDARARRELLRFRQAFGVAGLAEIEADQHRLRCRYPDARYIKTKTAEREIKCRSSGRAGS